MENAGLPTRNNFDLTRHYNIDLISNSSHARNALIFLLEEYNGDLEKGAAAKVVDEMLYNREALEFLEKDGIEANPMVASLAVGMSPSRKKYFENIDSEIIIKKGKSRILYKNLFISTSATLFLMILLILFNFNEEEYVDATYLVNDILEENYDYTSQNLFISQYSSDYTCLLYTSDAADE